MDILLWLLDLPVHAPEPDILYAFLGKLFGSSSKPKKPEETENDKALAEVSQGQMGRYQGRFAPLTRRLDRLSREDKSATLRGRSNADVMQGLGRAQAPGANQQMASSLRVGTRALGSGLTSGTRNADERSVRLTEGVMNAATGAGQAGITGLADSARMSTQESIRKMQEDYASTQRRFDVLGSLVGAGTAVAMNGMGGPSGGTPTQHGTFERTTYNHRVGKGGF